MSREIGVVNVKVKSKCKCLDHLLNNDESHIEKITLEVEPLKESIVETLVKRIDYVFYWIERFRKMTETIGYDNYLKVNGTNIGDILRIEYDKEDFNFVGEPISLMVREGECSLLPSSDIDYSYSILKNASPAEFEIWNKRVMRRFLIKNCNDLIPEPQAKVLSIGNLTQNWKIDKFVLKEY